MFSGVVSLGIRTYFKEAALSCNGSGLGHGHSLVPMYKGVRRVGLITSLTSPNSVHFVAEANSSLDDFSKAEHCRFW